MLEAMDERYDKNSRDRSNSNISRRMSQDHRNSPGLGGSFKTKTNLLGGLNSLMQGKRNNTSSFTPTN